MSKIVSALPFFLIIIVVAWLFLMGGYTPPEKKEGPKREIEVFARDFYFEPSLISLSLGENVSIILKNMGESPHDLVVEGLDVKTKIIKPNETDKIEFVASMAGTYKFYCSVRDHRQRGMEGQLIIKGK